MMIYWIRDLDFNYIEIAVLINVSQLVGLFSLRYWGRKVDQLGTYLTTRISSLFICFFPIFWIFIYFSPDQLKLPFSILVASLASLMFSGRSLALDNRLYEHMGGKSMIRITSKRIFYRGLSTFSGGLLGGALTKIDMINMPYAKYLNTSIQFVMVFSFLFRILVWIKFLSKPKGDI